MQNRAIAPEIMSILLTMQRDELTEYHIYQKIARRVTDENNRNILLKIAAEEYRHHQIWFSYTGQKVQPSRMRIWFYSIISWLLGYTFALKQMEKGEVMAAETYQNLAAAIPEAGQIALEENHHENQLLSVLDEERLQYVGSMVLGLNDALVELSGTLAGLTLALQNTKLIALAGLITGVSATLSMASSEFLSARSEGRNDALKSCAYTGVAYCLTVAFLVAPYLVLPAERYLEALAIMLITVVLIIACFTYYISVAKGLDFGKRFREMALISLSVAAFSFIVGLVVKEVLGLDI